MCLAPTFKNNFQNTEKKKKKKKRVWETISIFEIFLKKITKSNMENL